MSDILRFGSMITLTTGEYSDTSVMGPFLVERPFDMAEVMEEYRRTWVKEEGDWYTDPTPDGFIGYLSKEGYISDLPCRDFHIGSYGRLELAK